MKTKLFLFLMLILSGCGNESAKPQTEINPSSGSEAQHRSTQCNLPTLAEFKALCQLSDLSLRDQQKFYSALMNISAEIHGFENDILELKTWQYQFKNLTGKHINCLEKTLCKGTL